MNLLYLLWIVAVIAFIFWHAGSREDAGDDAPHWTVGTFRQTQQQLNLGAHP